MLSILINYLTIALFSTSFFYLLGGFVFNLSKISIKESFLKVFTHLLCGIFVSVFIYSIFVTRFNAVNIGLLIPFGILLSYIFKDNKRRESLIETWSLNYKIILLSAIVLVLVCGYNLSFIWDFNHHILIPPERDKIFYARVADYLNSKGIESNYLNYFGTNNPSPFHYFEIWIISLIALITGLNTLLVQQITVNSILFFVLYSGTLALINCLKRITIIDVFICLLVPFFIGIKFSFLPHQLFHNIDNFFFLNPIIRQKYFIVSILFLATSILFFKKKNDLALLVLLIGCYVNFSLIATIPSTLIILSFLLKTENKFKIILATLVTFAFILLFYFLNKTSSLMSDNPSIIILFKDTFSSIINLKTVFNNIAKSCTEIILIFLPFFIVMVYLMRNKFVFDNGLKPITIMVLMLFIVSAIEWSVFNKKLDSIQVFDNIVVPVTSVFFFIIAFVFISKSNVYGLYAAYLILGSWGIVCFINTNYKLNDTKEREMNSYSPEYLKEVKSNLVHLNNQGGALAKLDGQYTFVSSLFMAYSYKNYLALVKNNINIILLESTMDIGLPDDSIYRIQIIERQRMELFNVFINRERMNNNFVSEEQSRLDFIKENNLEFIIADQDVEIDSSLQKIVGKIITDKTSGERFVILNK